MTESIAIKSKNKTKYKVIVLSYKNDMESDHEDEEPETIPITHPHPHPHPHPQGIRKHWTLDELRCDEEPLDGRASPDIFPEKLRGHGRFLSSDLPNYNPVDYLCGPLTPEMIFKPYNRKLERTDAELFSHFSKASEAGLMAKIQELSVMSDELSQEEKHEFTRGNILGIFEGFKQCDVGSNVPCLHGTDYMEEKDFQTRKRIEYKEYMDRLEQETKQKWAQVAEKVSKQKKGHKKMASTDSVIEGELSGASSDLMRDLSMLKNMDVFDFDMEDINTILE